MDNNVITIMISDSQSSYKIIEDICEEFNLDYDVSYQDDFYNKIFKKPKNDWMLYDKVYEIYLDNNVKDKDFVSWLILDKVNQVAGLETIFLNEDESEV